MFNERTTDLDHLENLLDVVFGVIIAFPLLDLPNLIVNSILEYESLINKDIVSIILLLSTLIFVFYYWLEVRLSINARHNFDAVTNRTSNQNKTGVPSSITLLFLGSLIMVVLAACILHFSKYSKYKIFLLFNIAFWVVDLVGVFLLKNQYKDSRDILKKKGNDFRQKHIWFIGHFSTNFFYFYGLFNVLFYSILLAFFQIGYMNLLGRFIGGILILSFVSFRHFYWRSAYYDSWIRKKYKSID